MSGRFIINGRFLAKPFTGVTRVGRELLAAVSHAALGRPDLRDRLALAAPEGARYDPATQAEIAAAMPILAGPGSIPAEQLRMPFAHPADTIVSFCNVTPLLARRSIIWIHDAHIFEAPESYGAAYRAWHTAMLRGCSLRRFQIVTVSHYSRDALIRAGAPGARIAVIHNGGDHILRAAPDYGVLRTHGLNQGPFVVIMGSPAKHKNVPFSARALRDGLPPAVKIALVGMHQAGAYAQSDSVLNDPRIVVLPQVQDQHLRALYERAACVVVPSVLEGFGLPSVETLWAGGVLVSSNATSLPEVAGDAALYFDPRDAGDIAAKTLQAMQSDVAATLRQKAIAHRAHFTWTRAANQFLDGYVTPST